METNIDPRSEIAWQYYQDGIKIKDIKELFNVSDLTAWMWTSGREAGYKNSNDYHTDLAKRRGHESRAEYQRYLRELKDQKEFDDYLEQLALLNNCSSKTEYLEKLAEINGHFNIKEYLNLRGIEHFLDPRDNYLTELAKKYGRDKRRKQLDLKAKERGYKSDSDRNYSEALERSQNPENIQSALYITNELKKYNKSQNWLSIQLGVSRETVSRYCKGMSIPSDKNKEMINSIFKELEIISLPEKRVS